MTDNKPFTSWYEESNENDDDVVVRKATKEKMKPDSRDNSNNRKRVKYNSKSESDDGKNRCGSADGDKNSQVPRKPLELETDPAILQRRQKQIDYGKNTVGYYNFTTKVPIDQRTIEHPRTPDKYAKYSRRSWDTLIKIWRKKLHEYDTRGTNDSEEGSDNDYENL